MAAFRGMHVSPGKHSYVSVTDRQTDDGQSDPYVSLCFTGDTSYVSVTDRRRTKWSCLSDWTICGFDSDRKPCLYPITWSCLSPITWSTELRSYNGTYLFFHRLQYMLIQYRVSNLTIFWLHNDRKSFLSSFLPVTSSWMRTYTSCDDVTWWRQAAFAYAVNRSNALHTEKHLIEMGFRQEIDKINN